MLSMNVSHGSPLDDVASLRVFAAVAQTLSFTRGAELTGMTQSAVSHLVGRLERGLGTKLFERDGRTVRLSLPGETLLRDARRIFDLIGEVDASVRHASRPGIGRLRIGAPVTFCQFFLPDVLREFRECFPEYALSISPGDAPDVQQRLADGSLDIGLFIRSDPLTKLTSFELFDDQLGIVTHPLHAWARDRKMNLSAASAEPFILYSRTSTTYNIVEQHFARLGQPLRDPIELGSIEAIKVLVKLGSGVGVLAPWVVTQELADGSLAWVKLPGPSLRRRWVIATRQREPSIAQKTFIDLCRDMGKQIGRHAMR